MPWSAGSLIIDSMGFCTQAGYTAAASICMGGCFCWCTHFPLGFEGQGSTLSSRQSKRDVAHGFGAYLATETGVLVT